MAEFSQNIPEFVDMSSKHIRFVAYKIYIVACVFARYLNYDDSAFSTVISMAISNFLFIFTYFLFFLVMVSNNHYISISVTLANNHELLITGRFTKIRLVCLDVTVILVGQITYPLFFREKECYISDTWFYGGFTSHSWHVQRVFAIRIIKNVSY